MNTMSVRELYEWYEYYNEEPFMADRIEIQLATISLMIRGFAGSKGAKPKLDDFMIRKSDKKEEVNKTDNQKNEEVLLNFFFKNGVT